MKEKHHSTPVLLQEPDKEAIEEWRERNMVDEVDLEGLLIDLNFSQLEKLTDFLKTNLANPENCRNCGAINEELEVHFKDRIYSFTCWEIRDEDGKVLAQTDYKQFAKYCAKKE